MYKTGRMPRKGVGLLSLIMWMISQESLAAYTVNMTRGVTNISRDIYSLHMTILWVCVAIGVLVFSVMFYAIIYHRKSKGAVAAPFHEHHVVELVWTIIPFIILVGMAVPATRLLLKMSDTTESDLTIKITGYQWRWEYDYMGEDLRFVSSITTSQEQIQNRDRKGQHYLLEVDNPLVVPLGKKIRFLTTSNDVIHSWWVPAIGVKKDAIPGFINEVWAKIDTPGVYRGQCAELCGANHGYMPIVLKVLPLAEYEAWLKAQKTPATQQTQTHMQGNAP